MSKIQPKFEAPLSKMLSDHIRSLPDLLGLTKTSFEVCLAHELPLEPPSIHQIIIGKGIPGSWFAPDSNDNNIKILNRQFETAVDAYIKSTKNIQKQEKALRIWENIRKPYLALLDILCQTLLVSPTLEFINDDNLVSEMLKKISFSLFMYIDWDTIDFENEDLFRKLLKDSQQFIKEHPRMDKYILSAEELDRFSTIFNQLSNSRPYEIHVI